MVTVANMLQKNGHFIGSVTPNTSVKHAIQIMTDCKVEALPVFEEGTLVGIFSLIDILTKVINKGKSTEKTKVKEIMARNSPWTSPEQSAEEVLAVMTENQVHYLPVNEGSSPIGLLSMSQVLSSIISDQKEYIYHLENYVLGADYGK